MGRWFIELVNRLGLIVIARNINIHIGGRMPARKVLTMAPRGGVEQPRAVPRRRMEIRLIGRRELSESVDARARWQAVFKEL